MPSPPPDVRIAWLTVHGGVFHKLIRLQERLREAGLSCELLFAEGPPRGLKAGVDIPERLLPELAAQGLHLLPRAEVLRRAATSPARLLITDAHHDPDLPALIAQARAGGTKTAQMATLLGDFSCHGADHLLMQHPLTLFFELEYHHTRESKLLPRARRIFFTGNIFFEPTLNELTTGFGSRDDFCAKYGFDPARPICLWMPNCLDVTDGAYEAVMRAAREAGMNLAVKLHPWEYAFKKHGVDPWGLGRTSDAIWGVRAVDEPDSSWSFLYCDLAVMRGSATILEMPFWEKPAVYMPTPRFTRLTAAQAGLAARSSVLLDSLDQLGPLLRDDPPRGFSPADYAAARAGVRLDCTRDAYAQTVSAVREILGQQEPGPPIGSMWKIKTLYDELAGEALAHSLRPSRYLRFVAGRALRRAAKALRPAP
ncbi:MAG: hypothetical protein AB9900_05030 [Humidesulfovibrio sp.]